MRNRLQTVTRFVGLMAALLAFGACGGDDGAGSQVDLAIFAVDPEQIIFNDTAVGATGSRQIIVENLAPEGSTDLLISSINVQGPTSNDLDWCGQPGCPAFEIQGFEPGVRVAPGDLLTLNVVYHAFSTTAIDGALIFNTNAQQTNLGDNTDGQGRVDLIVPELAGRLAVTPDPINFGRIPVETPTDVCLDANLQNIGSAEILINDYQLVGGNERFYIQEGSESPAGGFALGAGEFRPVTLCFRPQDDLFREATLLIRLADETQEQVPVLANGAEPCLDITFANGYDFGLVPANETREAVFTITNCAPESNGATLEVDTLALDAGDNLVVEPIYGLGDLPEGLADGGSLEIEPGDFRTFKLSCTPEEVGVIYNGQLSVDSNDGITPELDIPLNCTGSDLVPPQAVCACRIQGTDAYLNELTVRPLDIIECTAAQSTDDDGFIINWEWFVDERPGGSSSIFQPANAETTEYFVDATGRFELSCAVTDDTGLISEVACDTNGDRIPDSECGEPRTDRVIVVSRPEDDLQIELSWSTPADPDETDEGFGFGADVDLHVLHPNGCWNDRTWDCHYRNVIANWGDSGSDRDDAELDRDDTDGAGPEVVSIKEPEDVTYRVAVHYYNDHGYGLSLANISIVVFGVPALEISDVELPATDYWWEVAAITMPNGEVTPIDAVYNAVPPCN